MARGRILVVGLLLVLVVIGGRSAVPVSGAVPTTTMMTPGCAGNVPVGGIWGKGETLRSKFWGQIACLQSGTSGNCIIKPNGEVAWDLRSNPSGDPCEGGGEEDPGCIPGRRGGYRFNRWYCSADQTAAQSWGGFTVPFTWDRLGIFYGEAKSSLGSGDAGGWGLQGRNPGVGDHETRMMVAGMRGSFYRCTDPGNTCAAGDPRVPDASVWTYIGELGRAGPGGDWLSDAYAVPEGESWALVIDQPPPSSPTPGGPTVTPRPTPTPRATAAENVGGVWMTGDPGSLRWRPVGCLAEGSSRTCRTHSEPDGTHFDWDRGGATYPLAINQWYVNSRAFADERMLISLFESATTPLGLWPFNPPSVGGNYWYWFHVDGFAARSYDCVQSVSDCMAADPRVPDAAWVLDGWVGPGNRKYVEGEIGVPALPNSSWALVINGATQPTPTVSPTATPTATRTPTATTGPSPTPTITPTPYPTYDPANPKLAWPGCELMIVGWFDHFLPRYDERLLSEPGACVNGDYDYLAIHAKEWWSHPFLDVECFDDPGYIKWPNSSEAQAMYNGHDGIDWYTFDYRSAASSSVYAVGNGRITKAGMLSDMPSYTECADLMKKTYGGLKVIYLELEEQSRGKPIIATYTGVDSLLVQRGDYVVKGQLIAQRGSTRQREEGATHLGFSRKGERGTNYPENWFDPFGSARRSDDQWSESNDIRSDQVLPEVVPDRQMQEAPFAPRCPSLSDCPGVASQYEIVDDGDPGFTCATCSAPATGLFGPISGDYRVMTPTGSCDIVGSARWQSSLPEGRYSVEAWISNDHRELAPSMIYALSARYWVNGDQLIRVNQEAGGGWVTLGIFDFYDPPQVVLFDSTCDSDGPPGSNYADPPSCTRIYVDAVRFQNLCPTNQGLPVPRETPQAVPTPRNTPCWTIPCGGGAG